MMTNQTDSASPTRPLEIRYLDALRFAFSRERPWENILLLTLCLFIPVVGPLATLGWQCEVLQRLVRRDPEPLPRFRFEDFTHYLGRGVSPFLVQMILSFGVTFVIMLLIMPVMMVGVIVMQALGQSEGSAIILVVIQLVAIVASFLLTLPVMVGMHAATLRAELTEDLGQTLRWPPLWAYARRNWTTILLSTILFGLLTSGLVLLGMCACYIGIFPAAVIAQIGMLHLRWQVYERHLASGGEPIPLKDPAVLPSGNRW